MALVFDLNTGKFCDDAPQFRPPEPALRHEPEQAEHTAVDTGLMENIQPSTAAAESMPTTLAGTDAAQFIRTMERKGC